MGADYTFHAFICVRDLSEPKQLFIVYRISDSDQIDITILLFD